MAVDDYHRCLIGLLLVNCGVLKMKDDSDVLYYDTLQVLERIQECIKSSDASFSRSMGYCVSYWGTRYTRVYIPKAKHLLQFAKALNVSYEYLLTGKNKKEYEDLNINIMNLYKNYKLHKDRLEITNTISAIICNIGKGLTKDVQLKTVLYLSRKLHIPPIKLLTEVVPLQVFGTIEGI